MGIELPEFQRRWVKKLQRGRPTLRELYDKLCPVDAGAVGPLGTCTTCGRQIKEPPEPDPVPNGVMVPVDEEKAERLREFYKRLNAQRKEREAPAKAERKKEVQRLPGETVPDDPPKGRDWAAVLDADGRPRHLI
jgi:hypothetical protein